MGTAIAIFALIAGLLDYSILLQAPEYLHVGRRLSYDIILARPEEVLRTGLLQGIPVGAAAGSLLALGALGGVSAPVTARRSLRTLLATAGLSCVLAAAFAAALLVAARWGWIALPELVQLQVDRPFRYWAAAGLDWGFRAGAILIAGAAAVFLYSGRKSASDLRGTAHPRQVEEN